jgi:hypothetical protein
MRFAQRELRYDDLSRLVLEALQLYRPKGSRVELERRFAVWH